MASLWTTEKVLGLAPDSGSADSARQLAKAAKWVTLGQTDRAVWGECKGSGAKPYQTRIDLSEPAFKCSCPSRKFPCKHSLGLFLLYADNPNTIASTSPPEWVETWISERDGKAQKKKEKQQNTDDAAVPDEQAQAKRAVQRQARVQSGIQELSLWLEDLVRQGFAWAQGQPLSFWDQAASRMVDSQAPGLARLVRRMADCIGKERWQERMLTVCGQLNLLLQSYSRIETLPEATRQDIRSLLGWTYPKEQLLALPGVQDQWIVFGKQTEQQDRLLVQKTWLYGSTTHQFALILDFAAGGAMPDNSLQPAMVIDGEVVYYPGACPLRAVIKERHGGPQPFAWSAEGVSAGRMTELWAEQLCSNPWLEQMPVLLGQVQLAAEEFGGETRFTLMDSQGGRLCLSPVNSCGWVLASIGGGGRLDLFGLWDGWQFEPVSVHCHGMFYSMMQQPSVRLARMA